jgi:pyruvate formate lyase activating enzyme
MGTCKYCNNSSKTISNTIGFCAECIREHFDVIWPEIKKVHQHSRRKYGLPETPPREAEGIQCGLCVHECQIPEEGTGFCGLRRVKNSKIIGGRPHEGNLSYYFDPLPTTSQSHALRCKAAAEKAGLHNVHIGNVHLLGEDY